MAEKTETKNTFEREYIIPLRRELNKVPSYKRANKAVKAIKEFLIRHMKVYDGNETNIKLDRHLNEFVWARGIKQPVTKIKVKVRKEGNIVYAELAEMSEHAKFKKAKLERRSSKASETKTKKKTEEAPEKKEESQEDKKEAEEKKASVVEAGKEMEKSAAKTMKHQTKMPRKPKATPRRMALQK